MAAVITFVLAHSEAFIAGSLFVLSEILGSIPGIKSNAVYQLVLNLLKSAKKDLPAPSA